VEAAAAAATADPSEVDRSGFPPAAAVDEAAAAVPDDAARSTDDKCCVGEESARWRCAAASLVRPRAADPPETDKGRRAAASAMASMDVVRRRKDGTNRLLPLSFSRFAEVAREGGGDDELAERGAVLCSGEEGRSGDATDRRRRRFSVASLDVRFRPGVTTGEESVAASERESDRKSSLLAVVASPGGTSDKKELAQNSRTRCRSFSAAYSVPSNANSFSLPFSSLIEHGVIEEVGKRRN